MYLSHFYIVFHIIHFILVFIITSVELVFSSKLFFMSTVDKLYF